MSLTVYEVLENSKYNREHAFHPIQIELAQQQEENYNIAKSLGADDVDDWYEWEEKVSEFKKNIDNE